MHSVTQASLELFTPSLPGCRGSLHLSTSEARAARQGRAAHSAPAQVPKERARSACHTALTQPRHGHSGTGPLPAAPYRGRDGAQETRPPQGPRPAAPRPRPKASPRPAAAPPGPGGAQTHPEDEVEEDQDGFGGGDAALPHGAAAAAPQPPAPLRAPRLRSAAGPAPT